MYKNIIDVLNHKGPEFVFEPEGADVWSPYHRRPPGAVRGLLWKWKRAHQAIFCMCVLVYKIRVRKV